MKKITSLGQVTREVNRQFKPQLPEGLRAKVACYGSFLSLRIDDPKGLMTVALAMEMARQTGYILHSAGFSTEIGPMQGVNYHMGGVVANWQIAV